MKKTIFFLVAVSTVASLFVPNECWARPRRRSTTYQRSYTSYKPSYSKEETATAQGVAEIMARLERVGHFGGHHPYYEGCGSSYTQESAYRNCCYANSGMKTIDVGYAQGASGMWYCCRRYSR